MTNLDMLAFLAIVQVLEMPKISQISSADLEIFSMPFLEVIHLEQPPRVEFAPETIWKPI